MGEVWVAKQSEPVKRRVALKLIKQGMDSRAVLARRYETANALARDVQRYLADEAVESDC
jgi:hypothetical protein